MSETEAKTALPAIIRDLAEASDKVAIEAYVKTLEPTEVPTLLAQIGPFVKGLGVVVKAAEDRVTIEKIIKFGDEWTDKRTGVVYVFDGDRTDWSVADYAGFHDALKKAGLPKLTLDVAVYKDWTRSDAVLNTVAKMAHKDDPKPTPENPKPRGVFAQIIDDFRVRTGTGWRPAHLKEKK